MSTLCAVAFAVIAICFILSFVARICLDIGEERGRKKALNTGQGQQIVASLQFEYSRGYDNGKNNGLMIGKEVGILQERERVKEELRRTGSCLTLRTDGVWSK